jgi:hypothetical protein
MCKKLILLGLLIIITIIDCVNGLCRSNLDCSGNDFCCGGVECCYSGDSCDYRTGRCYNNGSSLAAGYIAMIILLSLFACCICACLSMRRRRNGYWLSTPYMAPDPNMAYVNNQGPFPQNPPIRSNSRGFFSRFFGSASSGSQNNNPYYYRNNGNTLQNNQFTTQQQQQQQQPPYATYATAQPVNNNNNLYNASSEAATTQQSTRPTEQYPGYSSNPQPPNATFSGESHRLNEGVVPPAYTTNTNTTQTAY